MRFKTLKKKRQKPLTKKRTNMSERVLSKRVSTGTDTLKQTTILKNPNAVKIFKKEIHAH